MPIVTHPEWQQLALYAVAAAVLLILLLNIPRISPALTPPSGDEFALD